MSVQIEFSSEQEYALATMLSGKNVFLSGKAGSGKSSVIMEFQKNCKRQLVCLAPTGMAAMNIGGETIHRFFNLPIAVFNPNNIYFNISAKQAEILQSVEVILIDEVSMLRSDVFMMMDSILRLTNNCDSPFGGKQLIVVGDFCQLPPVVTDWKIKEFLDIAFGGIYAFNCLGWEWAQFESIFLNTVYRQSDPVYLNIVNAVRSGKKSDEDYLSILNKICLRPNRNPHAINLCCTRKSAAMINEIALNKLPDIGIICHAICIGDFPEESRPVSTTLIIKRNAKVMLLANKDGDYVNGDTGTVIDYTDGENPQVNVRLTNGKSVTISRSVWKNYEYVLEIDCNGKKQIVQKETGTYIQLPLASGYGITIHKSQGKTLEAAHIVLGTHGCFVPGQLYTALSRCRNLNELTIDRPVSEADIIVDEQVQDFYSKISRLCILDIECELEFDHS